MALRMVSQHSVLYFVKDIRREVTGSDLSYVQAGDGSLCFCTILELNPKSTSLSLEYCSLCSLNNMAQCNVIMLNNNSHFRMLLGNVPDITEHGRTQTSGQPSLRHIIENILQGSIRGDVYKIEIGCDTERDGHKHHSDFTLSLRVDYVLAPPACMKNTHVKTKELRTDPRENSTLDWNPDLPVHWLYRAWDMKERGSWLINHHLKTATSNCERSNDKSELCKYIWQSAFTCYSRALQLVSLCHWAEQTCRTDESSSSVSDNDKSSCSKYENRRDSKDSIQVLSGEKSITIIPTNTAGDNLNSSEYIDCDHFGSIGYKTSYSLDCQPVRLEFILLSNIALCQLKVGSNEYCAQNCSQALYLLARENKSIPYSDDYNDLCKAELFSFEKIKFYWENFQITCRDVYKVLFRRAQANYNLGKMDEAKLDLQMCIQLDKDQLMVLEGKAEKNEEIKAMKSTASEEQGNIANCKQIKAALQASESLLAKVCEHILRDQEQLVSRLRKRTSMN
ncbi:unnamed protein product [Trichobilharzia szidati]|nr:unnamed protein product [Trichobilharzia szidati]